MTGARHDAPPRSVDEALRRSADHARTAVSEALLAAHALLDAVSIAVTGHAASAAPGDAATIAAALGTLSTRLAALARAVRGGTAPMPDGLTTAVLDALDAEIDRWESRARDDADARAVLRAFLGLREILWEFGLRPAARAARETRRGTARATGTGDAGPAPPCDEPTAPAARRPGGRHGRVQRIEVDG